MRSGRQYLPSPEEMQTMTREQLDELERRQEEYLLTIRKIKVPSSFIFFFFLIFMLNHHVHRQQISLIR